MNILVIITTGRAEFKSTIDMLVKNISNFGHFGKHSIGLLVNYDTSFLNLKPEDFVYSGEYASLFTEINYLGNKDIEKYNEQMVNRGISSEVASFLCQKQGYSNKKNLALIEAIRRDYDIALFWDDDEYPFVCSNSLTGLTWAATDILGAHLIAYEQHAADLAFGFYTGYASPIPLRLSSAISDGLADSLGKALSIASDVAKGDTFRNSEGIFKSLEQDKLEIREIGMIDGGKWISGGNLSVRIESIVRGVVPPYFTPPHTRADDTILSMQLQNAKVWQIPAGIFHDAFLEYRSIGLRDFPSSLIVVPEIDPLQLQRFGKALYGWLGYAPIFLRIKYGSSYKQYIEQMCEHLTIADSYMRKELPLLEELYKHKSLPSILLDFDSKTEYNFEMMNKCYSEWNKIL